MGSKQQKNPASDQKFFLSLVKEAENIELTAGIKVSFRRPAPMLNSRGSRCYLRAMLWISFILFGLIFGLNSFFFKEDFY